MQVKQVKGSTDVRELELYAMGLHYHEIKDIIMKENNIDVSRQAICVACNKLANELGIDLEKHRAETIRNRALCIALENDVTTITGTDIESIENIVWLYVHGSSYSEIAGILNIRNRSALRSKVVNYSNRCGVDINKLRTLCLRNRVERIINGASVQDGVRNKAVILSENIIKLRRDGLAFDEITCNINQDTGENYKRCKIYAAYTRYINRFGLSDEYVNKSRK